jgi:hypothetical protein
LARGDLVILGGQWVVVSAIISDGSAWKIAGTALETGKEELHLIQTARAGRTTGGVKLPSVPALVLAASGDPETVLIKLRNYLRTVGAMEMLRDD